PLQIPQQPVRAQFIDADDGTIAVEAESLHDGESLVAEHALSDLQARKRDLRVHATNIVSPTHADVSFVRFDAHQHGANTKSRRAEFFNDGVELFNCLLRLKISLLE